MNDRHMRFIPLGESALTVEFGNTISVSSNQLAINASRIIDERRFTGLIETAPSYAAVTIYFDAVEVRRAFPGFETCFEAVRSIIRPLIENVTDAGLDTSKTITIEADFSQRSGPDLSFVADHASLTINEVVKIFTSVEYRVYMLGFLPGFTYMGQVVKRIDTPRLETPRPKVERGSIGIAGRQTGIYSLSSPGGWRIIGRTETELFDPKCERPFLFSPGDKVRFKAI